jgi:hypothetical protein
MNIGYFASFTVFLALNDADFSNAYLRSSPKPQGLLPLSTYLRAWGWVYAVVSLVVAVAKREVNFRDHAGARACRHLPLHSLHTVGHWLRCVLMRGALLHGMPDVLTGTSDLHACDCLQCSMTA